MREMDERAAEAALLGQGISDEGNAQCVHLRHSRSFAHSEALGWVYYNGMQWVQEGAEAALDRAIVDTLTARIQAATRSDMPDQYEKLIKFCIPNNSRIRGTKGNLSSLAYVAPGDFDTEPDRLNCRNGVLDLRTGEVSEHRADQRFMHCTSVDYYADANTAVWVNWLYETVGEDVTDWLQLAVGYSLTGHSREEVLFYLYGPARSGKGTFTSTLLALLGSPLAKEVNFATFTAQRTGDSQNFDLAPLKPCRFVAASESNAYERFNEAKVKSLTGGDEIYCAFKHRDHFNYRPQFKIWLSSNQPVNADPDDEAVWGRMRVIHFPKSHLGDENKMLKERMRSSAVLEGVLAWAVQGAQRWYELGSKGLPEPESSAKMKAQHRGEIDNVQAWIEECCVKADDHFEPNANLFKSYKDWCDRNGVTPKQQRSFSQALMHKGFLDKKAKRKGKVVRGFEGIGLSVEVDG